MATGSPDWNAAIRAAQPGHRQDELKSRKHPVRDGMHNHTDQGGEDNGRHHHQAMADKIADHGARLNAIEAHFANVTAAHAAHSGDGDGSGPS